MGIFVNELIKELGLHAGSVVSVVGSGGKTTLIRTLARELSRQYRVCVAASTKMRDPLAAGDLSAGSSPDGKIYRILKDSLKVQAPLDQPGIYYVADEPAPGHKLHGFSRDLAEWAMKNTDVILIEADGSRTLPLKGWAEHEPVVIKETQITIGVIPVYVVGMEADEQIIHRFPIFSRLTGVKKGEPLTREHLIRVITHPEGLFGKAVGEMVLYFSQISDETMAADARAIAADPRLSFIDKIIFGRRSKEER